MMRKALAACAFTCAFAIAAWAGGAGFGDDDDNSEEEGPSYFGFVRDANGRNRLETTRVPHGADDFNPFIEPGDDVRKIQGKLREIDCSGPVTRFLVETASGTVTLAIPDPSHLQARKAPPEFTCGAQPGASVTVVYAAGGAESSRSDGILRGIEFQ